MRRGTKILYWIAIAYALAFAYINAADSRYSSTSGNIYFDAGNDNNKELTVTPSGYIGAGNVTNPGNTLDVSGNANVSGQITVKDVRVTGKVKLAYQNVSQDGLINIKPVILADTSSSDLNLSLPNPTLHNNQVFTIKNTGSGNVFLNGLGYLIDNDHNQVISGYGITKLTSQGSKWHLLSQSNSTTIASDNLIGLWRLEESSGNTITDSSSYSTQGTLLATGGNLFNASGNSSSGVINNALSFSGNGAHINLGNPSVLNIGEGAVSVSAWVKSSASANQVIYMKGGTHAGGERYKLWLNSDGRFSFNIDDNTHDRSAISASGKNDGSWQHVAGTWSGNNGYLRIYVNGELESSIKVDSIGSLNSDENRSAYIGAAFDEGADVLEDFFAGQIDEVRVHNKELTASEVKSLATPDIHTGLVGHWKFDETSGSMASDSSGYGNHSSSFTGGVSFGEHTGKSGHAVNFSNSNYMNVDDSNSLDSITTELTLATWIYPHSIANDGLFYKGNLSGSQGAYNLISYSNKILFRINNNAKTVSSAANTIMANNWYHVVVTYDGQKAKVYINGVLNAESAYVASIQTDDNPLRLGVYTNIANKFDGLMDDARIYKRALEQHEIKYLYQSYPTWTPSNLYTDLWLDASDETTLTHSANQITDWDDKSGHSRNFTQGTTSRQPTTDEFTIGGLNAIHFDGTEAMTDANWNTGPNKWSFFIVTNTLTANSTLRYYFDAQTGRINFTQNHNSSPFGPSMYDGAWEISSSAQTGEQVLSYIAANHGGIYRNGTSILSISSWNDKNINGAIAIGGMYNGTSTYSNAYIGEVILIPGSADNGLREKIEGYLAHKWGLQSNLPTDHPYKTSPP